MLSDNVDELSQKLPAQSEHATQKQSKISYTRDFLISLSELDICKEISSGFDTSLLSELEGSSNNTLEHQRNYDSLPPNRLEGSSNYSRGSTGRWVTRSSGSSEKDGDLACDQDSSKQDSGRHFVNQTRRVWQNPENNGLLGSGGFPISSGYAGASALKTRGNGQYQLSRSTELYQPPRPYKGAHSGKDNTDSYNDETFGSSECSSEDRAEEERKRRESFELMRKEQQKVLQEQQKQKSENQKGKLGIGITALLENSEDRKSPGDDYNLSKDTLANDSSRVSHIQIPPSRPLVPPGFAGATLEKKICAQSSTPLIPEAGSGFNENSLTLNASNKDGFNSARVPSIQANENNAITSSDVEVLRHSVDFGNVSLEALGLQDTNEVWEDVMNKEEALGVANAVSHTSSTSGLGKLFGSDLAKDKSSSSNCIESQAVKSDEGRWSPFSSGSSKFAHMFNYEEDKKPVNESSSRDLLSLINIGGTVTTISGDGGIVPNDPLPEFIASPATPSMIGFPELCYPSERLTVNSGVLTCEDLEQSIMTEVKVSSTLERSMQGPQLDAKPEEQKVNVDDDASQHLLSLLLRGTNTKEIDALGITNSAVRDTETIRGGSGKTQTLEAFLGPAFMNELHSAEAPLSVKRGSSREIVNNDATKPQDFPWRVVDESLLFSASNEYITNQRTHDGKLAASDHTGEAKRLTTSDHNGKSKRLTTSDHTGEAKRLITSDHTGEAKRMTTRGPCVRNAVTEYSKLGDFGLEDGSTCIHLPDEDRLVKVGNSLDPIISEPSPFTNASKEELVHEKATPETLSDKLLAAILRGEERMSTHNIMEPPLMHGPYDAARTSDNLYNNINVYDRGPLQFPHTNHARPLFPQSGHYAHMHPLMRFMGPESIHHHPRHHFPENIIPQHALHDNRGPHSMMDRMPNQVNFPPRHPLQDFPRRGVSLSHQVNHMPSGYMPEMSNMHGFPLQQRQPNFDDFGLGMHGVGGGMGSSRPKAVEELIETEMRANSKLSHPAVGSHIPDVYYPGVEMNFRYR